MVAGSLSCLVPITTYDVCFLVAHLQGYMSTRVSYRFRANAQDSAGPEDRKSFLLATCEASSLQKLKTHPDFQGATEIRVWIDDAKPAAGWALLTDELLNTMVPEHPEGLILLVTPGERTFRCVPTPLLAGSIQQQLQQQVRLWAATVYLHHQRVEACHHAQ